LQANVFVLVFVSRLGVFVLVLISQASVMASRWCRFWIIELDQDGCMTWCCRHLWCCDASAR